MRVFPYFWLLSLVACGHRDDSAKNVGPDSAGCSSSQDTSLRGPVHHDAIHLKRVFQIRRYFNCNGSFSHQNDETVQSPTGLATIKLRPNFSPHFFCAFKNRQTCDEKGMQILHPESGKVDLAVDASFGFFNEHVQPGDNYIDYKCRDCLEWDETSQRCTKAEADEIGTFVLNINYQEERWDPIDVHPRPEDCAKSGSAR